MMHKTKFKAWDKINSCWINIWKMAFAIDGSVQAVISLDGGEMYGVHQVEIVQFTGLKDKNGVEIYEGDITNKGVVEWCECLNWDSGGSLHPGFYFKDQYEYNERGCLEYHTGFDEDIEVLGNRFENPELLK